MWMALEQKDTRTDHERYLEGELDALREQQEHDERQRDQDRKQRKVARREEYEYSMRQADDWPDALGRQVHLCRREVVSIGADTPPEEDYFEQIAQACERALVIWREVEASQEAAIEKLEEQIASIRENIRLEVADKLEAADPHREFSHVAAQLRNDELKSFLDW